MAVARRSRDCAPTPSSRDLRNSISSSAAHDFADWGIMSASSRVDESEIIV